MSTALAQSTITSKDGTIIAYSQVGRGPVPSLLGFDGALCYRAFWARQSAWRFCLRLTLSPLPTIVVAVAKVVISNHALQSSGKLKIYEALIEAVGGTAFVSGQSSGSALAIEAANCLAPALRN